MAPIQGYISMRLISEKVYLNQTGWCIGYEKQNINSSFSELAVSFLDFFTLNIPR